MDQPARPRTPGRTVRGSLISHVPCLRIVDKRRPCAQPRRTYANSELFENLAPPIPPNGTWLRSITDGSYRYVRRRLWGVNIEELYDLAADPCNVTDLRAPPNALTPQQQAAFTTLSAAMNDL